MKPNPYPSLLLLSVAGCQFNDPPRTVKVNLAVSASAISSGDQVKMDWNTEFAKTCVLTSSLGMKKEIPIAGTETLSPVADETITIACQPKVSDDKAGSASALINVHPEAVARLEARTAQISRSGSADIRWSCENAAKASLTINGVPAEPVGFSLTGSHSFKLEDDSTFELSCENALGKAAKAQTTVTVFSGNSARAYFSTFAEMTTAVDTTAMTKDCGSDCIYADFDSTRFDAKQEEYEPTQAFAAEIAAKIGAPRGKVALFTSRAVAFDLANTFAYGHRDSINKADMQARCEKAFPFGKKGMTFFEEPEFIDELESGSETSIDKAPFPIAYSIEFVAAADQGVIRRGTEATVSYKIGNVEVSRASDFTDYDKAKGTYRIGKDGFILQRSAPSSPDSERMDNLSTRASRPPNSVVVSTPAGAKDTASAMAVAKNYFPEPRKGYLGNPGMYDPSDPLCSLQPVFYMPPLVGPGEPGYYVDARNIDEKPGFVKPGSPRVVSALGTVACYQVFEQVANGLGLGSQWVVSAPMQFFVTDSRFRNGCSGADCAGKEPRISENDWRFQDIEPARNKCVDRWSGLDWNAYRSSLETACNSSPAYIEAKKKTEQNAADDSFAIECKQNAGCLSALNSMKYLSEKFNIQTLSSLIEHESSAMIKAKSAGQKYLISDAKLSPSHIADAMAEISAIEAGLDTAQTIHNSKGSSWPMANRKVHGMSSVEGFDSYAESKNSLGTYKNLLTKASSLIALDLRETGCSYEAKGRFRKYNSSAYPSNVKLNFVKQQSIKTKTKADIKAN